MIKYIYSNNDSFWRDCELAEKAIHKGDVSTIASIAHSNLGHGGCTFSNAESHAQSMCRRELERLAQLGVSLETQKQRDERQEAIYAKYEEQKNRKCDCEQTGRMFCGVCY